MLDRKSSRACALGDEVRSRRLRKDNPGREPSDVATRDRAGASAARCFVAEMQEAVDVWQAVVDREKRKRRIAAASDQPTIEPHKITARVVFRADTRQTEAAPLHTHAHCDMLVCALFVHQ